MSTDQEPAVSASYLGTIHGRAKLIQEVCNLIGFICIIAAGVGISGLFYLLLALFGLIATGLLLLCYLTNLSTKIQSPPWPTIELGYLAICGVLYVIFSFAVIISFSIGYIFAGVAGFIAAAAYLIDAFYMYKGRSSRT